MKIILLMTGDELLSGNIVDTNAAWLADQCWMLGHQLIRKITVGDDADAIALACTDAAAHADVVIVSGGLGATTDDITVESAANAFGAALVLDAVAWQGIQDFFKARGRTCTENNKRQAMLPTGASTLHNRVGTAPGVRWDVGHTTFFFLPGVPHELKQIFSDHIYPWLNGQSVAACTEHRLHCVGMPEATIGQLLQAVDLGNVRLSYRAHFPEVMLKVVGRGTDAKADVSLAVARMRKTLGSVVYGEGDDTLPRVVGRLLTQRSETVAVAESCTGGYIANQITNVPGASAWFDRGAVTYSNQSKMDWLGNQPHSGVEGGTHTALPGGGKAMTESGHPPEAGGRGNTRRREPEGTLAHIIDMHGAVSRDCAEAMAAGIRKVAGTTYGLSVTGIAGPTGGTLEKTVGTVFVGFAHHGGVVVSEHHYPQGREMFKAAVCAVTLNTLRLFLVPGVGSK